MNDKQWLHRCALLAMALSACTEGGDSTVETETPEAAVEAVAGRVETHEHDARNSTINLLRRSSAVIEGEVVDVAYSYTEEAGPRILTRLGNITVHAGSVDVKDGLVLETLGGPLPDETYLQVSELAKLTVGTRYILFLQARAWFYSPIVEAAAYQLEATPEGDDVLLSQEGYVVTGVDAAGLMLGAEPVTTGQFDLGDPFKPLLLGPTAPDALARGIRKKDYLRVVTEMAKDNLSEKRFAPHPRKKAHWAEQAASPDPEAGQQVGQGGVSNPKSKEVAR